MITTMGGMSFKHMMGNPTTLKPESRGLSTKMTQPTSSATVAPKIVVNGFGGPCTQGTTLKTNKSNRKIDGISKIIHL
jgi:hypothetical protein